MLAAQAADRVYASVDALAEAMQAQLAALAGSPEFLPWVRDNPTFKPRLSGLLSTAQGVRRVTILLDTGAALGLPPSGQPGPLTVATAAGGGAQGLGAPVLIHLSLGNAFRESMSILPMDMDVGDDLILGWDWNSSHDLHNLFQVGQVGLRSGLAQLQLALLPAAAVPAADAPSAAGASPQWPPPGSDWRRRPRRRGRALVGRQILYRWPVQGWVLGKVVRVSRAAGLPHLVRYARGSALGVGDAASLLDAPSYGSGPAGRWVMLCPA